MVDWNKIDNKIFEKLAYEYVTNKYPEVNWKTTQTTRDNNRDGEAQYNAPIATTIKYWYEAKYSKSTHKSIPKSHLDSTLVSCLLDGKVVLLAFITNAYISDDYKRRADIFSRQRDNLRIIYINGDEIEDWLFQNPEIEFRHFLSDRTAESKNFINSIKSACILENYDLYGNQFSKVKNIESDKEYVLYVSFYSEENQRVSIFSDTQAIRLLDADNRKYDQYNNLIAVSGENSFYIPIEVKKKKDQSNLSFRLECNNEEITFTLDDVSIIDIYNPKIIYGSQQEIKDTLFFALKSKDVSNALYYVIGNGGSGKSYLINAIYHDSSNPFASYVFSFSGDKAKDILSCYKIIIATLYGDIWNCFSDEKGMQEFNEIETQMLQQILSDKPNENDVEKIISYYKNNKLYVENNSSQTQIFIDDFHKLTPKCVSLLTLFFEWYIRQRYNCTIVLFSRPKDELLPAPTKQLTIGNIEPIDVETTITNNFKEHKLLPKLINKYPLPYNALHFVELLCQIHELEDKLSCLTEFETQLVLNNIYSNLKITSSLSLGKQIILEYENNKLVYCIYKFETGVSIEAISEFFGKEALTEIFELCQKRILKESSNIIFPYHDILLSAYSECNLKEMNLILESFAIFAERGKYISKGKLFSILIGIGKECFWKYRREAILYRDELHECAEYFQALEIALKLEESNQKSLNDFDYEDCKNLFIKANCIKYTDSYGQANKEFKKLNSVYSLTNNNKIIGLNLEAQTEIVNNLIWMLEVKKAKKQLSDLKCTFEELYTNNQIKNKNLIFAFLNYYNRLMFVNYMLGEGSESDYINALRFATELKQTQYIAFAKMDYAKSLYDSNILMAKTLIDEALSILSTCNEKRRILDAQSEKCFINDILNRKISYDDYSNISTEMANNHYIQSEIRIQLKIILLKLLYSDIQPSEIRNELDYVSINNTSVASGKRHQAYINHLYAASYYKENDIVMCRRYTKRSLNLMKEMGASYKFVHNNNLLLSAYNGFATINSLSNFSDTQDVFVLDIRLW
ncbi:MAG: hypothetical protein IJN03_01260 [Bacilli bacterium]|nr:hypothetical protein [Bacilli bacterium]